MNRLYMIGSSVDETSFYYDSFDEFIIWIHDYQKNTDWWDIDKTTMYMLEYDPDEVSVDTGFDGELYITNDEFGEDLVQLIRDGKYNHDKAKLFPLDVQQLKRMYFSS